MGYATKTEFEEIIERGATEQQQASWQNESILQQYFAEIGEHELLSPDEERALAERAQEGDQKAINQLVKSNLRLVVSIARNYMYRGLDLPDLISEGNLGLIHAIGKFDPERGYRFSTYATWWIRDYVDKAIMNQGRTIRLPIHVNKMINSYLKKGYELRAKLKREPTIEELAEAVNKPVSEVERLFKNSEETLSLDAQISGAEQDFYNVVESEINLDNTLNLAAELSLYEELESSLADLEPLSRSVIELRFGLNGHDKTTIKDTAEELSISRDRVRNIQRRGLDELRDSLKKRAWHINELIA